MRFASILDRGRSGVPLIVVTAFLISACSSTPPSPSPTAVPTPTVAPTVAPTPSPSAPPSAAPSASVAIKDPTVDLKIAAPYTLVALDPLTEATIRQRISGSLGSFGGILDIGVRQVTANGTSAGFVMVIAFPPGLLSEAAYKVVLGGLESSLGVTFNTSDVAGHTVSSATNATAGYAAYRDGDNLMVVFTLPTGAQPAAIAKALITANP
jgi:hypothetical protein